MRERAGLGTVNVFVSGGAPLPPQIGRFFGLIGFDFIQGYGMTECSPCVSVSRIADIRFESVGPPLPNVEVKIANPDSAGTGEIIVRGGCVTPGYRDNPEQTAELIRDGWLHTGDLGRLERGHLYITGRAKNLIVSAAGKNIYPEEHEEKLMASPYVLESVVFGRNKEGRQGEDVLAIIVPDVEQFSSEFGMPIDSPDANKINDIIGSVVRDVNAAMADYKRISTFEVRLDELEKTSTKKIKRFLYK
jgi:long-chain acyl-CoA synthetase